MSGLRWMRMALVVGASAIAVGSAAAEKSRRENVGGQVVLYLAGDTYAAGKAHGTLLAEAIRVVSGAAATAMGDGTEAEHRPRLLTHWRASAHEFTRQEVQGIADGAGVPVEQVELLQIWLARGPRAAGMQCAAFGARTIGGKLVHLLSTPCPPELVLARERSHERASPVIIVRRAPTGLPSIGIVPCPGAAGCWAGINAKGMSVSLLADAGSTNVTDTAGGRDRLSAVASSTGLHAAHLCRLVLERTQDLSGADHVLRQEATRAAGILLVGDGKTPDCRVFELHGGKLAVFGADDAAEKQGPFHPMAHAVRRSNQMVSRYAADADEAGGNGTGPAANGQPAKRYAAMTEWLMKQNPVGLRAAVDWLGRQSESNLVQVALVPTDLELWVGNPADSTAGTRAFRRFGFTELLAGGTPSGASPLIRSGVEIDPASERISKSTVKPKLRAAEATMPVTYQLAPQPFDTELEPWLVSGGVARYRVRFPSPLTTPDPENNTVHAELFQPVAPGPFPCVIVLHIAGGDFELSRFAAQVFAQREVAALFVKMPYYGERRPAGKRTRMVSNDLELGLRSMRQVVLDLRRACDWIEAQPSLDGQRIGVMGISLGAITGALASAIEPRISHACLVMGGAELQHILFESTEREAVEYRKLWRANGGTLETFADVMRPYDPATYADRLRQRIVFMISAADDQTIPKKSTLALWEATGRQRIVWYPCGHYTMAKYLLPALTQASVFFREWPTERAHE